MEDPVFLHLQDRCSSGSDGATCGSLREVDRGTGSGGSVVRYQGYEPVVLGASHKEAQPVAENSLSRMVGHNSQGNEDGDAKRMFVGLLLGP